MPTNGVVAACQILGLPRGAPARHRASQRRAAFVGPRVARRMRPPPPMALDVLENQALLDTLNSERFVDTAPAAVHATLIDEGRYPKRRSSKTLGTIASLGCPPHRQHGMRPTQWRIGLKDRLKSALLHNTMIATYP
jgi:hypothetical protein